MSVQEVLIGRLGEREESKFFSPNCRVELPFARTKTTVKATHLGESVFDYVKSERSVRDATQAGGSCF